MQNLKLSQQRIRRRWMLSNVGTTQFDRAPWHLTGLFHDVDDSKAFWQCVYNETLHQPLPSFKRCQDQR